jgi:chitinase
VALALLSFSRSGLSPAAHAESSDDAKVSAPRRVVAYFPIWLRNSGYTERDVDFTIVSHIAHFSVVPRTDGSIEIPDWGPFPDPALLNRAHASGAKVSLVVGGDHAEATRGFAGLAASSATRATFVRNLMKLVDGNGYDGVDIDWEFPQSAADRANLTALVSDLRAALGPNRTLSMAAPPADWNGQWLDLDALVPNLDWVGVMTYDLSGPSWSENAGHNAPLYPSHIGNTAHAGSTFTVDSSRAYYESRGVPPSKLLIGLPFFGERFDGAGNIGQPLRNTSGTALDYREIAGMAGHGWEQRRDPAAEVPYLVSTSGTGVISYDDAASIEAKCSYTVSQGLGGVIVWHLGKDGAGVDQPLLQAARGCR